MGVVSTPICYRGETEAYRDTSDLPKVTQGAGGELNPGLSDSRAGALWGSIRKEQ